MLRVRRDPDDVDDDDCGGVDGDGRNPLPAENLSAIEPRSELLGQLRRDGKVGAEKVTGGDEGRWQVNISCNHCILYCSTNHIEHYYKL